MKDETKKAKCTTEEMAVRKEIEGKRKSITRVKKLLLGESSNMFPHSHQTFSLFQIAFHLCLVQS